MNKENFSEKFDLAIKNIDKQVESLVIEFDGMKISDINLFIRSNRFAANETKNKLIDLIELEISKKINEQNLII